MHISHLPLAYDRVGNMFYFGGYIESIRHCTKKSKHISQMMVEED
jgi:hypothetical protein